MCHWSFPVAAKSEVETTREPTPRHTVGLAGQQPPLAKLGTLPRAAASLEPDQFEAQETLW